MRVFTAHEHENLLLSILEIGPEPIARREGVYDQSEGIMT